MYALNAHCSVNFVPGTQYVIFAQKYYFRQYFYGRSNQVFKLDFTKMHQTHCYKKQSLQYIRCAHLCKSTVQYTLHEQKSCSK